MKIAICFSGETGKKLAEELSAWLPEVLTNAKPFFAPHDIRKGRAWFTELAASLAQADAALLCLTDDDPGPWLYWEAGRSRSPYPVAFGFTPREVLEGPLGQYQLTEFALDDVQELMSSLNTQKGGPRRNAQSLERSVRSSWRGLAARIAPILQERPRPFLERICGAWWERVVSQEQTAISFVQILPVENPGMVRLHGYGYDREGSSSAEWHSSLAFVEPALQLVHYVWQGTADGAREGTGEIHFSSAPDGQVTGANGSFSDDDRKGRYRRKRFVLARATADERAIMEGTDDVRKAALAREKVRQVS